MNRIWTYVTVDADKEPLSSFVYFDPRLSDVRIEMGHNMTEYPLRDGRILLTHDSKYQYPVKGQLVFAGQDANLLDILNSVRYFAPVLYRSFALHLPLCIFQEGMLGEGAKAFMVYLLNPDPVLSSLATTETLARMNTQGITSGIQFQLDLHIYLDGIYTDFDDITSVIWNDRT